MYALAGIGDLFIKRLEKNHMINSRKHFLSLMATGAVSLPFMSGLQGSYSTQKQIYDVTEFGAVGDGSTPSADAFQQALDLAEANGGGLVFIPSGRFILEKTPLIGTDVQLTGSGCSTILTGERTGGYKGSALISNKGQQAEGYEGASGWGISNLAIDSPKTNGIVVTHANNVWISKIYGIEAYHHFIDTAGKNIICENLFLTGHTGTSTFQIDSLGNAQSIWNGSEPVSPNLDGTQTKDLILRSSIITATAGTEGNGPQHDTSIHFHGEVTEGILLSDLIIGGAENGIYMDDGLSYSNMLISNITSYNPGRAIWFEPSPIRQQRVTVNGLIHQPDVKDDQEKEYLGIYIHGTDFLTLSDVQLSIPHDMQCESAIVLDSCTKSEIRGLKAKSSGGRAILITNQNGLDDVQSDYIQIQGSILEGFQTGLELSDQVSGRNVYQWGNLFIDVEQELEGNFSAGNKSND